MRSKIYTTGLIAAGAAAISFSWLPVQSQTPSEPTQKIGSVQFDEKFSDPHDQTAHALAKQEGISLSQARSRLLYMNAGSHLIRALSAKFPDNFVTLSAISEPDFKLVAYFSDMEPEIASLQVESLVNSPALLSILEIKKAPRSAAQTSALAHRALQRMKVLGIEGTVASNAATGTIKLLVKDTGAAKSLVSSRMLAVPENTKVEYFSGIIPTTDVPGGIAFNGLEDDLECTTGFNVWDHTNYGLTTAAHCDNSARINVSDYDSTYAQPGPDWMGTTFRDEWTGSGSKGLDVQWSSALGADNLIIPEFYNGISNVAVAGGTFEYPGLYVCKFGRNTERTCGYVDSLKYSSPGYGDMPRFNSNSSYPVQSDAGDSGGPVFTGAMAVGQIHGRDADGNAYFTPLRHWYDEDLPIFVTCYCP